MMIETAKRLARFRQTKAYDVLMALPLIAWFARGGWHDVQNISWHIAAIRGGYETDLGRLQMVAMAASGVFCALLIVMLLVRSVPRARAGGVAPRLLALAGTFLGTGYLYLAPVTLGLAWQVAVVVLIAVAAVVEIWIIAVLGRSFSIMAEARTLVTTGPYAIVRHPLYVVETIGITAMLIQFFSPLAVALYISYAAAQIARAHYEEAVLAATFPDYDAYRAKTARFIPFVY